MDFKPDPDFEAKKEAAVQREYLRLAARKLRAAVRCLKLAGMPVTAERWEERAEVIEELSTRGISADAAGSSPTPPS